MWSQDRVRSAYLGDPGGITRWGDAHLWLQVRLGPARGQKPLPLSALPPGTHSSLSLLDPHPFLVHLIYTGLPLTSSFGVSLGPIPSGGTASVLPESSRIPSAKGLLPLQVSLPASAQVISPQAPAMSDSELHGFQARRLALRLTLHAPWFYPPLFFGFPEPRTGYSSPPFLHCPP